MILGKTVKMSSKHIVSYQSIIFFYIPALVLLELVNPMHMTFRLKFIIIFRCLLAKILPTFIN
jgi:hypothetical protein